MDAKSKTGAVLLRMRSVTNLRAWARRLKSVRAVAEGLNNSQIADQLGIHLGIAAMWRPRFVRDRHDGLVDAPRAGRPRGRRRDNPRPFGWTKIADESPRLDRPQMQANQ